jgi:hypothetical protein
MRKIFEEQDLMATVPEEVTTAVDHETLRIKNVADLEMRYGGRKKRPTKATLLSVIILHYMSLPEAQRDQILSQGVQELRDMMEDREPTEPTKPIRVQTGEPRDGSSPKKGREAR